MSLGPANGSTCQFDISDQVLCLVSVEKMATNAPLERRTNTNTGTSVSEAVPGAAPSAVQQQPPLPANQPLMGSLSAPPPSSAVAATPVVDAPMQDPGSPIINIEDSDDEAPASKRRKLDDGAAAASGSTSTSVAASA